jgi:hypothetical protein
MSTTPPVIDFSEFVKSVGEKISNLEKRFDILKSETENLLNGFAEGGKKLQEALETLSKAQEETIKNANIMRDEIRSLGGKLLERQNPAPVQEVHEEMGMSLFDLFE